MDRIDIIDPRGARACDLLSLVADDAAFFTTYESRLLLHSSRSPG